jgi:hypothetical protein
MTPERYFAESDALAEILADAGLDALVKEWRRAVATTGPVSWRRDLEHLFAHGDNMAEELTPEELDDLFERDPADFDDVSGDDAFTLDELISRLEALRAEHGGDLLVFMVDQEPVCRAALVEESETWPKCVVISDRY